MKKLNESIKESNLKDEENRKVALKLKEKLENVTIDILVKEKNGRMFGSVSTKTIKEELDKLGYKFDKKQIETESINTLGVHLVTINLYKDIKGTIKVHTKG